MDYVGFLSYLTELSPTELGTKNDCAGEGQ
jgi:hypothetical protein